MRFFRVAIAAVFASSLALPTMAIGADPATTAGMPGADAGGAAPGMLSLNPLTFGAIVGGVAILVALLGAVVSLRRRCTEMRDTNRRLSDSNARLAAALRAKSELLATSSHEIRTPLNGILGMTQVILADARLGPDVKERIELLQGAGETMRAMVDEILDRARIENGNPGIGFAPFDPAHLIDEAARFWRAPAEAKGLAYTIDVAPLPDRLMGDEARLRQILNNLLSNAVKYTLRGSVTLSALMEEGKLVILVSDTGLGIPEAEQEAIFERFHRVDGEMSRQIGGTGLGLAICRELTEAMGGCLSVESAEGRGALFRIEVPMEVAALPPVIVAEPAPTRSPEGKGAPVLLVVGLNPLVQRIIAKALEEEGVSVLFVDSADAACVCIAGGGVSRVLLQTDSFAAGPDPFAEIGRVTESARAAGLFLMLLYTPSEDVAEEDLLAFGADAVVAKPVAMKDLIRGLGLTRHAAARPVASLAAPANG